MLLPPMFSSPVLRGMVAGAMSMAAGEYVSVSSQSDTERADLDRERAELTTQPAVEREELAQIYVGRGVEPKLALQVADQLMAKDALGAHAREELGISDATTARPIQAALTLGGGILYWRRHAVGDGHCVTDGVACGGCVRCLTRVPRGTWRHRRESRRRQQC